VIITHFPALVLFSFLTAVVFGVVTKNSPREQAIYGAKVFGAFVGIALLLGWFMYILRW
jgi:heme/copper-type cytochrome/quinol oxidase subunit 4